MNESFDQNTQAVRPRRGKHFGGVILVIVGVAWLLQNLGFSWAKGIWFPLIIIALGLYIMAKR